MCSSLDFLYVIMSICLGSIAPLPSVRAFTNAWFLMKCDFVSWIECAQMDPTPHLDACVSEEVAPLRMVTGVVPATTSLMPKLEQRSII